MKRSLLILILAAQSVLLIGLATRQEWRLAHGTVILLETAPIDPRDLLRGDYVILNYKISTVPLTNFSPTVKQDLPAGTPVYVALEPRGKFHEIAFASTEEIAPVANQVVIRGRSVSSWRDAIRLEYGLEKYYVREGTGSPAGKLTVQAAVPASGRAVIKEVLVNGIPYAKAMNAPAR